MTAAQRLKAPYPYFGGKAGAADLIWSRLGDTPNYVEPFAGSLAVLLARPHAPKTETVNDLDGLLSNAWRAIRLDPDAVAFYADAPVSECDLHAKHITLVNAREELTARLMADPEYYDAKLAGYWLWGACNWIGGGWCSGNGPWVAEDGLLVKRDKRQLAGDSRKLPHLGDAGKGISKQLPHLGNAGKGISKQLPHLGNAGAGDSSPGIARQIPYLASAGAGVTRASLEGISQKLPYLASGGVDNTNPAAQVTPGVLAWMRDLSARLKRTRITCGDWTRVLGDSVTTKHGLTAVLLDPPYDATDAQNDVYGSAYDASVAGAAWEWAVANGDNPLLRIAYCTYDDGRELPPGWTREPWKARKGYQGVKGDGTHNGHREVIYFSPRCLNPDPLAGTLFGGQP